MRSSILVVVVAGLCLVGGCASANNNQNGSSTNVVTGTQLRDASSTDNLYEALFELRPQWLRARPRASLSFSEAEEPVVYVFGIRRGSVDALYGLQVEGVRRVEYLSPVNATTRFGTNHSGGAIIVDLRQF